MIHKLLYFLSFCCSIISTQNVLLRKNVKINACDYLPSPNSSCNAISAWNIFDFPEKFQAEWDNKTDTPDPGTIFLHAMIDEKQNFLFENFDIQFKVYFTFLEEKSENYDYFQQQQILQNLRDNLDNNVGPEFDSVSALLRRDPPRNDSILVTDATLFVDEFNRPIGSTLFNNERNFQLILINVPAIQKLWPHRFSSFLFGIEHIYKKQDQMFYYPLEIDLTMKFLDCQLADPTKTQFSFVMTDFQNAADAKCSEMQETLFKLPTSVDVRYSGYYFRELVKLTWAPFWLIGVFIFGSLLSFVVGKFEQKYRIMHRAILVDLQQIGKDKDHNQNKSYVDYLVTIFMGSIPLSGLNSKESELKIILFGDVGKSQPYPLNFDGHTLNRGSVDNFLIRIPAEDDIGQFCGVRFLFTGPNQNQSAFISRISVYQIDCKKRYNIRCNSYISNKTNEFFHLADFRHSYVFSWCSFTDKLYSALEFGNPFIAAFWTPGNWPTFSCLERMCLFLIELSIGCLVTAYYIDSVTLSPTVIFGYDVTDQLMAFQIEVLMIMPFMMFVVEPMFERYIELRSPKTNFVIRKENKKKKTKDGEKSEKYRFCSIPIKTNKLTPGQKQQFRIIIVSTSIFLSFLFFFLTLLKLGSFSISNPELISDWQVTMYSEIIEEFTFIHPLFSLVGSIFAVLSEKEIDWEEWMPYGHQRAGMIVQKFYQRTRKMK